MCYKCGQWVRTRIRTAEPINPLAAAHVGIGVGILAGITIAKGVKALRKLLE